MSKQGRSKIKMGTKMADQVTERLFLPFLRSLRLKAARPSIKVRVLDEGCGARALAGIVSADLYMMLNVDRQALPIARKQHPRYTFQSSLPPAEPKFATVVALVVIEHIPNSGIFIRELSNRLSSGPDSFIVCKTPHPVVNWVHIAGAKIGLFRRHASEEHKGLLDRKRFEGLAFECDLKIVVYLRFLLGANQLVVFQRKGYLV